MNRRLAFIMLAGPLAWFVQLCAGVTMFGDACWPKAERRTELASPWTWPVSVTLTLICLLVALAASLSAIRLVRTADGGRTRFLAAWGVMLSVGAAGTILATAVMQVGVPPCGQ